MRHWINLLALLILSSLSPVFSLEDSSSNDKEGTEEEGIPDIVGSALDPHPDPNDEHYEGMIYIGRHEEDGTRMGFDKNNGTKDCYEYCLTMYEILCHTCKHVCCFVARLHK